MHIRKIPPESGGLLDEPINMDGDGNELLLSDVLGHRQGDMILKPLEDDVDLRLLHQAIREALPGRSGRSSPCALPAWGPQGAT